MHLQSEDERDTRNTPSHRKIIGFAPSLYDWPCKLLSFKQIHICLTVLTVSSNQSLDALASPLPESVHHEEQQREDEEGRDAADDQPHPAGHRVEQTVPICRKGQKLF